MKSTLPTYDSKNTAGSNRSITQQLDEIEEIEMDDTRAIGPKILLPGQINTADVK